MKKYISLALAVGLLITVSMPTQSTQVAELSSTNATKEHVCRS